jgi:hypothetical protein
MNKGFISKARESIKLRIRLSGYSPKFLLRYLLHTKCTSVPIFICGTQRSGTNMLADCFDKCRSVEVQHDVSRRAYSNYRLKSDDEIEKLVEQSPGTHVVFKPLLDTARIPRLLSRLHGGFVVWIYRNYVDVVLSMKRSFVNSREELDEVMAGQCRSWRGAHFVDGVMALIGPLYRNGLNQDEALALSWLARNQFLFASHMDAHPRVALLEYDSFIASPAEQFSNLVDTLGIRCGGDATGHVRMARSRTAAIDVCEEIEQACETMMRKLRALQRI